MLVRLLYASRASDAINSGAIDAILARSREFNPAHGITGVLCHSGDLFIQVLEGGRTEVNRLYCGIVRDTRHHEVTLIDYAEIDERRFTGWAMGRVNLAKVNPSLLLKYSERASLDPQRMTARVAHAMLEDLISTAAIIGRADGED
ncbi:MAG: BLUF domain-containing protein [Burkholderiaceae bacterium]|nr:BLUF domain-containing protein [Burkholderiaceae bacterium]